MHAPKTMPIIFASEIEISYLRVCAVKRFARGKNRSNRTCIWFYYMHTPCRVKNLFSVSRFICKWQKLFNRNFSPVLFLFTFLVFLLLVKWLDTMIMMAIFRSLKVEWGSTCCWLIHILRDRKTKRQQKLVHV